MRGTSASKHCQPPTNPLPCRSDFRPGKPPVPRSHALGPTLSERAPVSASKCYPVAHYPASMANNFLEQLLSEWYEFQGYFVRRNVLVGKRPKGGYECELDVVAFHPEHRHLVHLEPSMDASSWRERERRYKKKFDAGRKYIPKLFAGLEVPGEVEQIAVLVFASKHSRTTLGGGQILLVEELLERIFTRLKDSRVASSAMPEGFPILRAFQFVADYRDAVWGGLSGHVLKR